MNDQLSQPRSNPCFTATMMNPVGVAYFDPRFVPSGNVRLQQPGKRAQEEPPQGVQAQEVAGFLLSLKHRSVTPEPHLDEQRRLQARAAMPQLRVPMQEMPLAYPGVGAVYGFPGVNPAAFGDRHFLQQVHSMQQVQGSAVDRPTQERPPTLLEEPSTTDMPWEMLLADSKLVYMKDKDLVPDSLFVAMAQMKICSLTQADRVGCYKARDIGFVGMCCKHCGGQPGFGRYFPNSVRSLAQTTTSQTILKHIGSKCRFCPPHVRQAVLELQRQQAAKEGIAAGRPRYGSRKIFFQRIWARLHGKKVPDADEEAKQYEESSHASESEGDDRPSCVESDEEISEEEDCSSIKNKRKKSKGDRESKRQKVHSV